MFEKLKTWWRRREYQDAVKYSLFSSIAMFLSSEGLQEQTALPHPLHSSRIPEYKKMLASLPYRTVSFGDSILDLSRNEMSNIDLNFNVSGEWAEHTHDMIDALYDSFTHAPKTIVVGCLGGNPMLVYQNYEYVKRSTLQCLDNLRKKFPTSKILVYGCPPNYSINVLKNAVDYQLFVYNWTVKNKAEFISLYSLFKGFLPNARWSSDGIHLTEYGAWKLNKKIGELSG